MLPFMQMHLPPSPPRPRSQFFAQWRAFGSALLRIAKLFRLRLSYQFTLRSCFVCMTLAALAAAWIASERRESSRHLALAKKLEAEGYQVILAKRFCTPQIGGCRTVEDSWWQEWLGELCGERIVEFWITSNQFTMPVIYPEDLVERELPWIADVYQLENIQVPRLEAITLETSLLSNVLKPSQE
jgi:hypothetical protein